MRAQCGAFAKTKGQRCKNRALPGSGYCILHLEKAPLVIGALIGAVLSLAVSITWNKIVPSDEQRELRELKNEIRPVLDIARKTVPNASDKDALDALVREISAERGELRELKTEIQPVLDLARKNSPNASDKDALVALVREVNDLRRVQKAVTSFETEVVVAVSGNWAASGAPHANVMVMGDAAEEYLDIKLTDGSTKRVPLHVQGGVTISKLDANTSVVRYRTQVRPGNWPINEDSRVLRACEGVGIVAWGINKSYVTDGMIRVQRIEVRVFINGQKKLEIAAAGGGPFPLPSEGSAKLDFRKHQEFETGS
jgi:hypothetical protein